MHLCRPLLSLLPLVRFCCRRKSREQRRSEPERGRLAMTATRRMRLKDKRKRGIVLILVVSLLALFLLLGPTLALAANVYVSSAKLDRDNQPVGDPPETEMDLVMQQLLGENYVRSSPLYRTSLQGQGLLADLYGIDGFTAYVAGTPATRDNGQILAFEGNNGTFPPMQEQPYERTLAADSFSKVPDYYCGRVLTFLDGQLSGKSTRIMHYAPPAAAGANPTIYVEMPKHDTQTGITPQVGNKFLINGGPFNGAGFGYQSPG